MRMCAMCGAEIHPAADIGGVDHYVVVEDPMTFGGSWSEDGKTFHVQVAQRVGTTTCAALRYLAAQRA